jgi:type I restriction enzyme, S subunit
MKTNWQTKKLGDLLELCDAGTWGDEDSSGLPLLRSTNMQNGNLVLDDLKTIALSQDKIDQYTLLEGDILMTKSSGSVDHIGKSLFITSEMSGNYGFSNFTQRLRPNKSQVLPMWIYYKVSDPATRDFLLGASQTTTGLRNLKISELKELEIPLPPLATQRKIVAILDEKFAKLREAKRLREEAIADTSKILSATLREIFEEGKGKFKMVNLGDVATLVRGPFGGSLKKEIFVQTGIAVYEQGNVIDNILDNFRYFITSEKFEEMKRFEVSAGDILMSCSGTIGKFLIIPSSFTKGIINQALLKITPKKNITVDYLKYALQDYLAQSTTHIKGGAIKNIASVKELKQFTIPLPSLTEQKQIITRLDALSEKLRTLRELQTSQLADLKQLEKAYLREAFRGELC